MEERGKLRVAVEKNKLINGLDNLAKFNFSLIAIRLGKGSEGMRVEIMK